MGIDPWGIQTEYVDAAAQRQVTPQATIAALRKAMAGDEAELISPPPSPVRVIIPGQVLTWPAAGTLSLEDGGQLKITNQLPPDVPLGYHRFQVAQTGEELFVIATPGRCPLPPAPIWGWSCQLYATRSRHSWGIGDLADLRTLASWSHQQGAGVLMLNPLCAVSPTIPQERSPYSPVSRRFRNPIYLRVEEVPGASELLPQLETLRTNARNLGELIEWDKIIDLKMQGLNLIWSRFKSDPDFENFCAAQGNALTEYAKFCVLAEELGPDWRTWPTVYHKPAAPHVQRFVQQRQARFRFHQWVQWLIDRQLSKAATEIPLMQDMPIGVDPGGADAWVWQHVLAKNVAVGAPPDVYNAMGQNWGLPPWIPHCLQAARYEPFIQTIRAMLRHAGGLRIDHALGLFRLFWIPQGMSPAEGGYVRYPYEEMLAIIALESHRAGAFVVGEDLGTTEPIMREQLAKYAMLSYRLLWFEKNPPAQYPRLSLAAVTTHDLPTVAGLWSGSDLADQELSGTKPNAEGADEIRKRLQKFAAIAEPAVMEEVVKRTYSLLAQAASLVRIATLDDALLVARRPNMPGAKLGWPNWSFPLPHELETLQSTPLPDEIAKLLASKQ